MTLAHLWTKNVGMIDYLEIIGNKCKKNLRKILSIIESVYLFSVLTMFYDCVCFFYVRMLFCQ